MEPINQAHVALPGLAVVEIAACDNQTALVVQELLATRWATVAADRTTRVPGKPGIRLRCSWTYARSSPREACDTAAVHGAFDGSLRLKSALSSPGGWPRRSVRQSGQCRPSAGGASSPLPAVLKGGSVRPMEGSGRRAGPGRQGIPPRAGGAGSGRTAR
ncbi:DUF6207 family protein [Streptomyces sp. NPDC057438]|uniref:DUF6207 family protein n=1 Tax=Streptomyces sp. NPDC057438 TaxID=3346133 RepID=UPI00367AAE75